MGNDIEISVSVSNNSAAGVTAVNNSLNRLRDAARDAGRGLDGLTGRATAAAVALRGLKDSAQDAARALRSLNQAARTTDTRLTNLSDRSRTLRRDTDDLDGSMRRLTGTLGQVQGNLGTIRVAGNNAGGGMNQLRKAALLLSPALIPIAAAAVPIAQGLGAAAVAVGAFGLALGGQVADLAKVSQAQTKYQEAVKEHGATSEEAAKAEAKYLQVVRDVDPATRRAAAAFGVFKDEYKDWTKSLAGDTMPVVTKSFAIFGSLLPRLSPLVRATSSELDRLMTVLAGGVNSSGFERLVGTFTQFASGTLSKATDGLVRFMRSMSGGGGSPQLTEFMAYVRDVGPQVGETLKNLGQAMAHLVAAASDVGVGILSAVNAFAKLVEAIPTGTLSNLLQFVIVLKAVKLAAAGLGGAGGAMAGFGASLAAMQAASAAAGGGLTGLVAAFNSLSRAAKVALIGTGIGLLVVALSELSDMGKKAPPDVDKLTTSLRHLGDTGKLSGEAARAFGKDLSGLADSLQKVTDPKGLDQVQQSIVSFFGADSTPVKDAKENIDAVDKALANLVKNGQADLAASALASLSDRLKEQGFSAGEVRGQMDDYKAALADAKFESQLAAQSMGLFGEAALAAGDKLAAQKASADGLRQSLQALNDVNRTALGGMIGFEAAIDAAAKAASENAGALSMTGGQLNLNSEGAQAAANALNDLAAKTEEAAASARESGSSWEAVNGIYSRGRSELIKQAQAMGLSRSEAALLAEQILQIPDKTTRVKMSTEDATRDLEAFNAAVKRSPGAKSVTVKALTGEAETLLRGLGYRVTHLPNGKVKISASPGNSLSVIGSVSGAIAALHDRHITLTTEHRTIYTGKGGRGPNAAGGGLLSALPSQRLATGGEVQFGPNGLLSGPGTGTSDSIVAMFDSGAAARVSNTEFVVNAASTRKYLPLLEAINDNRLELPGFKKGGKVSKAETEARRQATGDLTISHFGRMAGYRTSEIIGDLGRADSLSSLVGALNNWRSIIMKATHGGVEKSLLKALDSAGKKLLNWEKQLTKASGSLEKSKARLDELKQAASQLRESVRNGVLGSANITRGASGDSPVTVASIMGGLTQSRDKATAFSKALADLQKKGLSGALLQQIAEAGIEGGGLETAGALLGASSSEISSLNNLQSQISSAATAAGKVTADAVYASQIKTQEKLVKAWQTTVDKLRKSMENVAKSIEKSIERAFGKKAAGGITGAASGGARGSWTLVGEHEPELVKLPFGSRVYSGPDTRRMQQQAWASMLNVPRRGPSTAVATAPAAVSQPLVIQLKIGEREFGELWVDTGRNAVRARGSIEATLRPPRGR